MKGRKKVGTSHMSSLAATGQVGYLHVLAATPSGFWPAMATMPVISEEGQGRPRNNYHPRASTFMGNLIIKEAIAAHLEYMEVCGDEGDQPMQWEKTTSLPEDKFEEFKLCPIDQRMFARVYVWMSKYEESQSELYAFQWWELKPIEEIMSMLWELPLSLDTYEDIVGLIKALKSMKKDP